MKGNVFFFKQVDYYGMWYRSDVAATHKTTPRGFKSTFLEIGNEIKDLLHLGGHVRLRRRPRGRLRRRPEETHQGDAQGNA